MRTSHSSLLLSVSFAFAAGALVACGGAPSPSSGAKDATDATSEEASGSPSPTPPAPEGASPVADSAAPEEKAEGKPAAPSSQPKKIRTRGVQLDGESEMGADEDDEKPVEAADGAKGGSGKSKP